MCCGGTLVDNYYTSCCTDRFALDLFEYGAWPKGNMPWGIAFNLGTEYCCYISRGHVEILTSDMAEHCLIIRA